MSFTISTSVLKTSAGTGAWWTTDYGPAQTVPVSGIYRCLGCEKEITSNKDDPFPPQTHHQHTPSQGKILWRLNVKTATDGHPKPVARK